jgi:hypothetical protein
MAEQQVLTIDEIRKIAPRYKGKPENFRRDKVGKPRSKEQPTVKKEKIGPKSDQAVKGEFVDREQKPTPQRNNSIILDSIFGIDVHVVPIHPRETFTTNLAKLPDIVRETYHAYEQDVKQLDRQMIKEDLVYYSTGLMWLRLLDIKSKQGKEALSSAERDLRKATMDVEFNVPQPIHSYLTQIGSVTDKFGKETDLEIPPLPTTINQGHGGYHSAAVDGEKHNLYEEVPSLGIAGDMLRAAASQDENPEPTLKIWLDTIL